MWRCSKARVLRYLEGSGADDLIDRVAVHAVALGVKPERIQVKELRSRWGSCSVDGVLSFSWRADLGAAVRAGLSRGARSRALA
jgi:predicted metal-dependent hydrolase